MKNNRTSEKKVLDIVIKTFNDKKIRNTLFINGTPILKKTKETSGGRLIWEVYVIYKDGGYLVEECINRVTGNIGYKLYTSDNGWTYLFDSAYADKDRVFEAINVLKEKEKDEYWKN